MKGKMEKNGRGTLSGEEEEKKIQREKMEGKKKQP